MYSGSGSGPGFWSWSDIKWNDRSQTSKTIQKWDDYILGNNSALTLKGRFCIENFYLKTSQNLVCNRIRGWIRNRNRDLNLNRNFSKVGTRKNSLVPQHCGLDLENVHKVRIWVLYACMHSFVHVFDPNSRNISWFNPIYTSNLHEVADFVDFSHLAKYFVVFRNSVTYLVVFIYAPFQGKSPYHVVKIPPRLDHVLFKPRGYTDKDQNCEHRSVNWRYYINTFVSYHRLLVFWPFMRPSV